MKKSLREWEKYADLLIEFGKQADWQALGTKELSLTTAMIQLFFDRLVTLPSLIKQVRFQFMAHGVVLHIKPTLLPLFSVRLTHIDFKWEKGKHYAVLGFNEGNSLTVIAGLKWLINHQAKKSEVIAVDGVHKEIRFNFDAIPQFSNLLATQFEEGSLGDILWLKIATIEPSGIVIHYGLDL